MAEKHAEKGVTASAPVERAVDKASDAPDEEKASAFDAKQDSAPTLKLVLSEDADADEVAVAVPGLDPAADYTDEHGRVVVSSAPVEVPADVGALIDSSAPYVKVAD